MTRFATQAYSLDSLKSSFSHLTNTSINKHSPHFNDTKHDVGAGCKWSISKLRDYFEFNLKLDFERIWKNIQGQVLLSLLPIAQEIPSAPKGCFELYGFGKPF